LLYGGNDAKTSICPCFSQRQWKYFVTVLLGLIECEERKIMTGLLQVVAEQISLSGLSRFLSKWPWEPIHLVQIWLQCFRQRLGSAVEAEHSASQNPITLIAYRITI
jgi:hypothetical protein